jgi:hypothetical protein
VWVVIQLERHTCDHVTYEQSRSVVQLVPAVTTATSTDSMTTTRSSIAIDANTLTFQNFRNWCSEVSQSVSHFYPVWQSYTHTGVLEYLVTEPPLKSDGTPRYAAPAAKVMLSMDPRWYCTRLMHMCELFLGRGVSLQTTLEFIIERKRRIEGVSRGLLRGGLRTAPNPHSGTAMHACMLATCAALALIAVRVVGGHQSHALGADIDQGKTQRRAHGPSVRFLSEGPSGGDSHTRHERWRRASTTLEPTTGSGELDRLSHLSNVADTVTQLERNQCPDSLVCMTLSSARMHEIGEKIELLSETPCMQHAFKSVSGVCELAGLSTGSTASSTNSSRCQKR